MATPRNTQPDLRLVDAESAVYDLARGPESTSDRIRRLQIEARTLALEQIEVLEKALMHAAEMARDIAEGGDAYPVGAREIAGRLVTDLPGKADTIRQIVSRAHG